MTLSAFYNLPPLEQERWIADWEIGQETCAEHGGPRSECSDHERLWYPQRSICYATMNRQAAERAYDAKHDDKPFHDGSFKRWAAERSRDFPFHYRDGVRIWVATEDVNPDDQFL